MTLCSTSNSSSVSLPRTCISSSITANLPKPVEQVVDKHALKILNLSNHSLSTSEITLLSRGLKFTPTPNHNILDIQGDIDEFCRKLRIKEFFHTTPYTQDNSIVKNPSKFTPPKCRNHQLDQVVNLIESTSSFTNLSSLIPPKTKNLQTTEKSAITTLINNKNIIIKEADKGGIIVIMERDFYIQKIASIINDPTYYESSNNTEEEKIIKNVKEHITKSNFLTSHERDYITNFESKHSNLYGLPKIHKSKIIQEAISSSPTNQILHIKSPPDLTFRPIVAGPSSPTHRLSNFLHLIFSTLIPLVPSFIRDSTSFLLKLPQSLNSPSFLCTMDIVNLYSNIPHDLGLEAIHYWIMKLPPSHSRFPHDFILKCLDIVLKNNIFNFNNNFYK